MQTASAANGADVKKTFAEIVQQEFDAVIRPACKQANQHPDDLIGLAFSGGGIRSATFNLGVLQALADADLLKKIDYLSTVSGGGYIGSFFTSMLARPKQDGSGNTIDDVQEKLRTNNKPNGLEAAEISFLRQYSNYLTPKIGLSTDSLAAISVWFTNTLLNQIVLIASLVTLSALVFLANTLLLDIPQVFLTGLASIGALIMLYAGGAMLKASMNPKPYWVHNWIRLHDWRWICGLGLVGAMLVASGATKIDWLASLFQFANLDTAVSPYWWILPALIAFITLLAVVFVGLAGKRFLFATPISSFMREWWARMGGVDIFMTGAWLLVFILMLYLPLRLDHWLSSQFFESFSVLGAITAAAVYLGKSGATSGLQNFKIKEKITIILPWLVILGLVVFVSFGTYQIAKLLPNTWPAMAQFASISAAAAFIAGVFAWRVDINMFSQHSFYLNRLTRAYLGAANNPRNPNLFTGFDESDDVKFADCAHRPLHIVNTALNLTSTKNLAWQQRKAASFAFTPFYSGFQFPDKTGAYRPTSQFTNPDGGVKLGSIMAVSGAAASPNMGYHSSPATAFLMTMFNVRLGRWFGNPALEDAKNPAKSTWLRQSPALGFACLVKELFAKTKEDDRYLYLSDGGHFENLGVYELVRRRCRLIIAVDVGQDAEDRFEDLGNAIRKCQIDLGVTIDMRVDTVRKDTISGLSPKHYAVGKINYPDAKDGVLLYIKSSLTGDEPADLQNYKREQPDFPHHSTADQFFDEKQFESYRHLGQHIMEHTVKELVVNQLLMANSMLRATKTKANKESNALNVLITQLSTIANQQIANSISQNTA